MFYKVDDKGAILEAILDVVLMAPGCLVQSFFDETIRCPHAARVDHGVRSTASTPGVAALGGETRPGAETATGARTRRARRGSSLRRRMHFKIPKKA